MFLVADTHVHIYPFYDLKLAFDSAITNLNKLIAKKNLPLSEAFKALLLTERGDCNFYQQLKQKKIQLPTEYSCDYDQISELILVTRRDGEKIAIFPGQQIATKERLEVLALLTPQQFLDGLTLEDTIKNVKAAHGLAVLNWGLGKWLPPRANAIYKAATNGNNHPLCLGDSALRPWFWHEPLFSKLNRLYALPILAGTDPLYFKGEEQLIGSYGVISNTSINLANISSSIKEILANSKSFSIVGKRNSTFKVIIRQFKTFRSTGKI